MIAVFISGVTKYAHYMRKNKLNVKYGYLEKLLLLKRKKDIGEFDRKSAINNKCYFNLKASNGQVIGTSPIYSTRDARERSIDLLRESAPGAAIQNLVY
jgi:uncharacterized protein YegP (UPF0339 family)